LNKNQDTSGVPPRFLLVGDVFSNRDD
jgi:hypothetical protein